VPTYGYHCPSCEAEFEVFQRMTDAAGADCPRCGTPGRRLFFPTGIVFKGSGFYKTDSRRAATAAVNAAAPAGGAKASTDDKSPSGGKSGEKAAGADRAPAGEKAPAGESTSSAKKDGGASAAGSTAPS
jgi:putative FmdB family regulatory protein